MTAIAPLKNDEVEAIVARMLAEEPMYACKEATIRGVHYDKVFAVSDMSLRDLLAMKAQEFADEELLVFGEDRYTFARAWEMSCRFANVLIEQFGVGPGDRIALAMRNYPEWCLAYVGIVLAGATVLPLNAWWREDELCYALKDSGAKIVIGDAKRLGFVAPHKEDLGLTLISAREESDIADASFDALIAGASNQMPQVAIDPESDFCILYTSGSTGIPKGVLLTHRSVINAVLSWSMLLNAVDIIRPEANIRPENPAILLTLPLFHVTASHNAFLLSFLSGRKIVFMYRWDIEEAVRLIKQEKVTNLTMVPTQSHELVEAADPADLATVSDITTGGAKRPAHHVTEMNEKLPSVRSSSGYGLTETNALACYNGLQDYLERPDSTGRVVPPVTELKIMDPEMNEVPVGEVGEICIKSPANFRGYLGLPEETAKALTADGWFKTGDLGKVDADGFVYIVDRIKDLIIRGGENISCLEVENEIHKFDAVQEVTVFGIPDEKMGEIVGAAVYGGEETVDAAELHAFLTKNIAGFKVPEKIWISPQPLLRGTTGKVDKRATREFALQFPPHFSAS